MNRAAILSFFSGKSLTNAIGMMDQIEASIAQGFWIKGLSRSALAVMTKANVAAKVSKKGDDHGGFAFQHDRSLPDPRRAFFNTHMILAYGTMNVSSLEQGLEGLPLIEAAHPEYTAFVRSFITAMLPLARAMAVLDATRPPPVFTEMKASPTVSRTLASLQAESAYVCPMKFDREVRVGVNGAETTVLVCRLLWPEGIKHNTSRYTGACSCQACGHTIRRGDNWVPMVLTTAEGPKSLWVGRDCAKTLFGVDYSGTLEIAGGREA